MGALMTPANKSLPRTKIFQLKISLDRVQPPIWRRLQVPGDISLFQLHFIIQLAMGWTNSHLHEFRIAGQNYGTLFEEAWELREIRPEIDYQLAQVIPDQGFQFGYVYDFGDNWKHTIQVEAILEPAAGQPYPACLAGGRACPPEDVGGTWGYAEFLEAIAAPNHPEHASYLTWVGGHYDPDAFDREQTDREVKNFERSEMVRIYQRYYSAEVGPELKLYLGVSEWLVALTAEEQTRLDELPLRRDTVSLLSYLRDQRVTGTQATGNLPLKVIRAVAPNFVHPPALESKIGDKVYQLRSEYDVWPVYFIHTLLEVGGLLTGGPGRRLRLTPKGVQFLAADAPIQVWFLLETWWHHTNWLIAYPLEGMGDRLPYDFNLAVLDQLLALPVDKLTPLEDFADRLIQTTGLQWKTPEAPHARSSLHWAIERMVISILENFHLVARPEQAAKIDKPLIPQLQPFTVTKLGTGLLKAIAGGIF
jgi:hypothetical protein